MQSELIAEGGMGMFFLLNQFQLQYIFNAFLLGVKFTYTINHGKEWNLGAFRAFNQV